MIARRRASLAVLAVVGLVALAVPATAADGSTDPLVAAQAMAADPTTVISAHLESDATGTTATAALMEFNTDDYNGFPSGDDDSFLALASGEAQLMNDGDQMFFANTVLGGMTTNQSTDLAGLTTEFAIPEGTGTPCFIVDLKFMSEEFPEYVGSSFNDFVVGRINDTSPPSISDTNTPVAPGNFLRDGNGDAITVNNNYNVNAARANDTVYDGASPTLQARSEVPDSTSFTFTLWIADVGDSIYDSMVFMDNARVERTDDCAAGASGPSETTVKPKVGTKIQAKGWVIPSAQGQTVTVILYKKSNGKWSKIDQKTATLGAPVDLNQDGVPEASKFSASFNRPNGGDCKVKAKYGGDSDTFPSSDQKTFNC